MDPRAAGLGRRRVVHRRAAAGRAHRERGRSGVGHRPRRDRPFGRYPRGVRFPTLKRVSNPLRSVWDEPRARLPAATRVARLGAARRGGRGGPARGLLRSDVPLRGLAIAVTVGLAPTLLWRRTHPFAVVAIAFGSAVVVDIALIVADAPALDMVSMIYFLILPYALFRWGSGRRGGGRAGHHPGHGDARVLRELDRRRRRDRRHVVLASSMVLGVSARTQHGARERRLEQAKAEERVQLARELHDTVAHHVSAIAIQAQAGRALAAIAAGPGGGAGGDRGRGVADPGRDAGDGAGAAQPGARGLRAAARGRGPRAAGRRLADRAPGRGDDCGRPESACPPAVDAAVFRIAREAVTNSLRHARNATRVDVRVEGNGTSVLLSVRDDGDPVLGRVSGRATG